MQGLDVDAAATNTAKPQKQRNGASTKCFLGKKNCILRTVPFVITKVSLIVPDFYKFCVYGSSYHSLFLASLSLYQFIGFLSNCTVHIVGRKINRRSKMCKTEAEKERIT